MNSPSKHLSWKDLACVEALSVVRVEKAEEVK